MLETLRRRAELLAEVRRFFANRGYLEVETPVLSRDVVVDGHLEPFVVASDGPHVSSAGEMFLQTSPEFAMKRLLAAGATAIFQVARVFRQGERGRLHNPEFTMVEWYRAGDTHHEQMGVVEELARAVLSRGKSLRGRCSETEDALVPPAPRAEPPERPWRRRLDQPFPRLTYDEAFEKALGTRVLKLTARQLAGLAAANGIAPPPGLDAEDRDGWLNLLLATCVEPSLGTDVPTFLHDYPASQSALARVRPGDPPVAERFELYVEGIELCNGYHELTDADELRRRIREQSAIRHREGRRSLPAESRLLAAMDAGLPPCSGVALGFDRLVMLALGFSSVDEVIPFPFEHA